jgi:hypothetical protein
MKISNVDEAALFWKNIPASALIAMEEISVPTFKASKIRPHIWSGANAVGNVKWKQKPIYHSKNPRAQKDYTKSTFPVFYKWSNKSWMRTHLFTTWCTEYFKLTAESYCSEKKNLSQNISDPWQCIWSLRSSSRDGK